MSTAGCHGGDDVSPNSGEPTFANWPETLNGFRFRWTAEPGIDLLLGPAVPLRAYLESHRVGDLTFDANDAYPGFERAVPRVGKLIYERRSDLPYELWGIQPATESALAFRPPMRFFGNEYFHVLTLAPIEGGHRAYVCDGLYDVFYEGGHPDAYLPGTFRDIPEDDRPGVYLPVYRLKDTNPNPDTTAIKLWRVEFTDQSTPPDPKAPPMVTVPQQGLNPAPLGDVFGPWRITGANSNSFWGPEDAPYSGLDDDYQQMMQRCLDLMPHDAAQRQALYTGVLDTPPSAEPAVPGWPDSTA